MSDKKIKRGLVRFDGRIFWAYQRGKEYWVTPDQFERKKEIGRKSDRKRYEVNHEKRKSACRAYHKRNPEKLREKNRNWIKNNPEKRKAWYDNKGREYMRAYEKKRRREDPLFSLARNLRGRVRFAFRRVNLTKPSGVENLLGATLAEAKAHIESQFQPGMSWENYGKWHVDHVIPLASAKTAEELVSLCHHLNLQPLWASDNIRKGAKMPHELKKEKA
jgi:hypothetical protein